MIEQTAKLITKIFGTLVLIAGILFLCACFFDILPLIQLSPSYTPLKINTILCFIFTGIGLIASAFHKRKVAVFCGWMIGIISCSTLIEYGLAIDLGIDHLFLNFKSPAPYAERMHPLTAWGFLFISCIFLLSKKFIKQYTYYFLVRLFAAFVFIIGVVALGGYITQVEIEYSLGSFSAMSPQAATLFILTGIGLYDYAWEGEFLKDKNSLAISLTIFIPMIILFGSVILWRQSIQREYINAVDDLKEDAQLIKHHIITQINYSIHDLQHMALRWEARGGMSEQEWNNEAQNYIQDSSILTMLERFNPVSNIHWLAPKTDLARLLSQFIAKGDNLYTNKQATPFFASPFKLAENSSVFFVFIPINSKSQEFLVGGYDAERVVKQALLSDSTLYNIQLKDGTNLIYSSSEHLLLSRNAVRIGFTLLNRYWTITLEPKEQFFVQKSSFLPYLELLSGILFTLFIGSTLYYTFTSLKRNKLLVEKTKALERSEKRQQQLVNGIHDHAIIWLDLNGDVETWNSGAERIYEYSSEEIINNNFSYFFTKEDKASGLPVTIIKKAMNAGVFRGEVEQIRKSHITFWASLNIEMLRNSTGERIGFAMIVRDISQRRLLENERSKLISIIEESPDFIGMTDLNGTLIYHNRGAKQMVGLSDDADLNSMKIANMHPVWAFNIVYNHGIPAVLKDGIWSGETALLHQVTGEEIPVLQTIFLHKDPLGNPVCLNTIMRDITDRKRWEEDLKNSEETFRASMEHSAIGMAFVSPKGKWLKVNKALCDMLGYTEEELLSLDFQTLTHPDDLQKDLNFVRDMLEKKIKTYHMEKRYFHKNGQIIFAQLNVTLAWKANGKPNYFISQVLNIGERKSAEEAQERLISHLVRSNMDLEHFAYAASHDLQEPLRMVVSFSDILMNEHSNQLNSEATNYLSIIAESGKRMQRMILDLLEFSRASKQTQFQSVDCSVALQHALENMRALIEESNAKITSDPLPNVEGNFTQIAQVLQHLIVNAIQYQNKESIPFIHVGVEDDGKFWRIFVKDNGIGIPEESQELIFQPFRRLHSWGSIKGTGMGLALCKKIIENHGGKIWAAPDSVHGSIFYFTLRKA